jgi:rhodanese-related sulfurtransferase
MVITPQQAKEIMDTETGYVLLDVRSQAEFKGGHIEGAVCIPDSEIAIRAEDELPDNDQLILVYCRSGMRSRGAAMQLEMMGYTNVKDFGGIMSWPYEVVTD